MTGTARVPGTDRAQLLWSVTSDDALRAALARENPWVLEMTRQESAALPTVSALPFLKLPLSRPRGSHRCFYMHGSHAAPDQSGVIAFKGLEPLSPDLADAFQSLRRPCYSPHTIAEHLIFEEAKVPGAVLLTEAVTEAERARDVQRAHLRSYGTLARLPVPLMVLRHNDQAAAAVMGVLDGVLSAAAMARARPWLSAGLGVYVYYYPAAPVRVRDLASMLDTMDAVRRDFALLALGDPERLLRRWTGLFARLLHLGWLPGSLASLRTGICCQPQNACLDGGFVDLDSLTPLDALPDDRSVYAALATSVGALLQTVADLLGAAEETDEPGRYAQHLVRQFTLGALRRSLREEARPELALDPRIGTFFSDELPFAELLGTLSARTGGTTGKHVTTSQEMDEFAFATLKDAMCR